MDNAPCAHFGNFAGSCFVSGLQSHSIHGDFFGCTYLKRRSRGRPSCIRARGLQSHRISLCAIAPVLEIAPMRIHLAKSKSGSALPLPRKLYLSTGSHDFSQSSIPLTAAKITIGADAFIGARAFVLPGVTIGERSVIGACSVVTEDVPSHVFAPRNPSRIFRPR